jgi:lysozyme family protein
MVRGKLDRRRLLTVGLAAAAAAPLGARILTRPAVAQATGKSTWSSLTDLAEEAQRLGLSVPRMGAQPSTATDNFEELQPAIIDFIDGIRASAPDSHATSAEIDSIIERASELLREKRNIENPPRDVTQPQGAAPSAAPSMSSVADEYRKLFSTCVIREDKRSDVQWCVTKLTDPDRRKAYDQVYTETCVPWYFVGIIHGMEASFDLTSHLHNGDSIKAKTVHVPKGRPVPWLPPSDWGSSAADAMRYDKLDEKSDWDLATMLYRFEAYNGFGTRSRGINTPYLWSYSNQYSKGKYVADGVWDPNAVSKQCGAAVMLKALVEAGLVAPPA